MQWKIIITTSPKSMITDNTTRPSIFNNSLRQAICYALHQTIMQSLTHAPYFATFTVKHSIHILQKTSCLNYDFPLPLLNPVICSMGYPNYKCILSYHLILSYLILIERTPGFCSFILHRLERGTTDDNCRYFNDITGSWFLSLSGSLLITICNWHQHQCPKSRSKSVNKLSKDKI